MENLITQTRYDASNNPYTVQVPAGTVNNFANPTGPNPYLPPPQQSSVITPASLQPQPQINVPTGNPPATPAITPNVANSYLDTLNLTANEQSAQTGQESLVAKMLQNIQNQQGESAYKSELLKGSGLNTLKQDLQGLNSKILQKQAEINQSDIQLVANMRAEERRDTLAPFAQQGQAKLAGDAAIMRALKTSEIGVLNAQAIGKQGDIQLAKETIQEAVDAKYAPYREQNALYEAQLKAIQPFLSSAEKKQALAQQFKLNQATKEIDKLSELQKSVLSNASLAKAPDSVLLAINNAKSIEDVIKAGKGFLVSPKDELELRKLRGDIAKNDIEYAKTLNELNAARQTIGGTTGDPNSDLILGSSKYGKTNLDGTQLIKIQQATNALGSLENLQGLLTQGKDGLKLTGPLQGRARQLLTKLGGDADAAAINSTIQGLIPTVARGIFGEVGVLTDADIANYRKTVPNLTSTEAQNKLVAIVMYDVLSRSIGTTLTTNAMNMTNVSNFYPMYQNSKNKINQLKADLGYIETIPITPENKAKLDGAWNSTFGSQFTPQNITNSLNNLVNYNG